jgi:hypothetical protein
VRRDGHSALRYNKTTGSFETFDPNPVAPPSPKADDVREALESAAEWCAVKRAEIGNVDGYDYRSGEEAGLRDAEIELRRRALTQSPPSAPAGEAAATGE